MHAAYAKLPYSEHGRKDNEFGIFERSGGIRGGLGLAYLCPHLQQLRIFGWATHNTPLGIQEPLLHDIPKDMPRCFWHMADFTGLFFAPLPPSLQVTASSSL